MRLLPLAALRRDREHYLWIDMSSFFIVFVQIFYVFIGLIFVYIFMLSFLLSFLLFFIWSFICLLLRRYLYSFLK